MECEVPDGIYNVRTLIVSRIGTPGYTNYFKQVISIGVHLKWEFASHGRVV